MATTLTYAYKGLDTAGKSVKGKVDAGNEAQVASRLRTMGISPTLIAEAPSATGLNMEINLSILGAGGVKLKDIAVMSRQMATMISAGLSLLRTLAILSEQTENKALAKVLDAVRADVETGTSLSDAMTKHPKDFPPLMLNLIRAGETGGFLEGALMSIAQNYEAEVKLTGRIKSALTYPVIVLLIAMLAVTGMLIFIVPVFDTMFKQLDATLPLPTQFLVVLSGSLVWLGPLVVVATIVGLALWKRHKNDEAVRKVADTIKLKMPVFGPLMKKVAVARLTRNLATMMGAGVPILKSLAIVGSTSGNWVIEQSLNKVQESVRQGNSIAGPLSEETVFPAMVTQMIAVGEDSGALETMLHKISDFYDQEVESTTEQLTALIEPLMIAFIGVVVGGMIVALYMPIFDIFNHLG